MKVPMTVSLRHVEKNPKLTELMANECRELELTRDKIISCRVNLEKEQKVKLASGLYRVRVEVTLPGRHRVVVKKESRTTGRYSSLAALIRDVFDKAGMVMERYKEKPLHVPKSYSPVKRNTVPV